MANIEYAVVDDDGIICSTVDASARFAYWSFTKTIIAVCVLKLAEKGLVDLDTKFQERAYTLRQLLNHTAGLPDYGALTAYHDAVAKSERPWTREKLMAMSLANGGLFEPGCGWAYSNIGFMLVREHLEAVTRSPLAHLIATMIGEPLGLASLDVPVSSEAMDCLNWRPSTPYDPAWVYHGCVTGSAQNAAHILHAVIGGRLLSSGSLEQMLKSHRLGGALEGRPWTECGYGLGMMDGMMGSAGRALGHSGGGPFSVCAIYHFPDRPRPVTIAAFADGVDVSVAERAAARLANQLGGSPAHHC